MKQKSAKEGGGGEAGWGVRKGEKWHLIFEMSFKDSDGGVSSMSMNEEGGEEDGVLMFDVEAEYEIADIEKQKLMPHTCTSENWPE
jgi:hypothetical protein